LSRPPPPRNISYCCNSKCVNIFPSRENISARSSPIPFLSLTRPRKDCFENNCPDDKVFLLRIRVCVCVCGARFHSKLKPVLEVRVPFFKYIYVYIYIYFTVNSLRYLQKFLHYFITQASIRLTVAQ